MHLLIDHRQEKVELKDELIHLFEQLGRHCLGLEGWDQDYEISLSLVDNEEIHQLNKEYRGKDYPTDVLSFPLVEENEGAFMMEEKLLGDIVISVEKALEQAEEYGHSFEREMTYLFVHSMFHLMGYDHEEEEEAKEMREKEETVLKAFGLVRV